MRRFFVVLAVAALGAVTYVATAPGGLRAAPPTARQFAALKKQVAGLSGAVKTLKGQVGTLKGQVGTLKGQVGTLNGQLSALQTDEGGVKALATADDAFIHTCLTAGGVVGVSRFGDPLGSYGYAYQDNATNDFFTSALDVDTSSTPGAFFQAVAASCVSSGGALRKPGMPAEHRESTLRSARH